MDRLSSLPDDIIIRILTLLPTNLSGSTSILARRWRFLWAHVPNLCFEGKIKPATIDRVMLLHKAKFMNTFSLSRMGFPNNDQIQTWVTTAIELNLQNLHLFHIMWFRVPQCVFTCKTLVELSLVACIIIPSLGAVYLPSLKKLHLDVAKFDVDQDPARLFSGCPILEELLIRHLGCLTNISSPTITRFTFKFRGYYSKFDSTDYRLMINAPELRYLKLFMCPYNNMSLSQMNSLIKADIGLVIPRSVKKEHFCGLSGRRFFDSLHNVKCLKLSGHYENEFVDIAITDSIGRFNNLTKLELSIGWRFLIKFLENADNLEALTIREVHFHSKTWMEPMKEEPCACLLFSLRTLTMYRFGCTDQELNMVRYLLKNAQVLKRMEIYCQDHGIKSKAKSDAIQKISLFHRGSRECELAFF